MVWLLVTLTLLRELLRAVGAPLRMLLYLPFRHHWRAVARQVLADVAAHPAEAAGDRELLRALFARARPRGTRPAHVFLSAGETSGDGHAVRLLQALAGDRLRWSCFGSHALAEAGGTLLYPLSEHAVMGLRGVLRQLPLLMAAFARYLRLLRNDPPDLVVLVDYPGLHVVMAKAARRAGIPVLHYIAPQYWAWGPWRMRRYRRSVDATLTILPFETAFFRRFGVPARYVGHPLLDELAQRPTDPAAVAAVRARPTLCILPGSRTAEIHANLPGMLLVAQKLAATHPGLRVVVAHRDGRRAAVIRALLTAHGDQAVEFHEGALAPWLAGARVVLAKSGTGSLEACLFGVPTVVVYHLAGPLLTFAYHNVLSVPWIAGANLVAGRRVVPEFCFHHRSGWDDVAAAADRLWRDGPARELCLEGLRDVRQRLGAPGASDRAAAVVRTFLAARVAS